MCIRDSIRVDFVPFDHAAVDRRRHPADDAADGIAEEGPDGREGGEWVGIKIGELLETEFLPRNSVSRFL